MKCGEISMSRDEILELLRSHYTEMVERYDIASLSIFGSISRDEHDDSSDLDVLVSFKGAATFDGYMGLKFYLEELLGRHVDLITPPALKPRLRRRIEKELLHVA